MCFFSLEKKKTDCQYLHVDKPHLVIDISDIHDVDHIVVKVVSQHAADDIEGDVGSV